MAPYSNGMHYLKWWAEKPAGCRELSSVRSALTDGAAFHEIIKQKYPGTENPSWSAGNAEHHLVGDFRRAAENREAIVKSCVNQLLGAKIAEKIAGINDAIAELDKGEVGE